MVIRIEITGANDLRRVSAQLRAYSTPKAIRKELTSGLRAGAKPAATAVKAAALTLPDKPGNATHGTRKAIARATGIQVRLSGRNAGVMVRVRRSGPFAALARVTNDGKWRHPVFSREGKPRVWVTQYSRRGWFDKAVASKQSTVRAELKRVLDNIEKRTSHQ